MSHPAGRNPLHMAFRSPLLQQLVAQSMSNANSRRDNESSSSPTSLTSSYSSFHTIRDESPMSSPIPQYKVRRDPSTSFSKRSTSSTLKKDSGSGDSSDDAECGLSSLNVFSDLKLSSNNSSPLAETSVQSSHSSRAVTPHYNVFSTSGINRSFTSFASDEVDDVNETDVLEVIKDQGDYSDLPKVAIEIQNILKTRRTISNFRVVVQEEKNANIEKIQKAVRRAVQCAVQAPNHKRTEPFTFKVLLDTEKHPNKRLAMLDILERHVHFKTKGDAQAASSKKQKWSSVPCFVVVLCRNQPSQGNESTRFSNADDNDEPLYDEIPFVPPVTLRQLEDVSEMASCGRHGVISNFIS